MWLTRAPLIPITTKCTNGGTEQAELSPSHHSYRRRRTNELFAAGTHQTLQLYPAWNVFAGAYISSKIRPPKKKTETGCFLASGPCYIRL